MNCPNCGMHLEYKEETIYFYRIDYWINYKCEKCKVYIDGDDVHYLIYYKNYHTNRYGYIYNNEINKLQYQPSLEEQDLINKNILIIFNKLKKYIDNVIFE